MESGLPGFPQDSSCPVVLKNADPGGLFAFVYGAVTHYGSPFQVLSTSERLCNSLS